MPKEVRLNDKMWFGKYRGRTIKDLLNIDRYYLDDLVMKNKIIFSKNVTDYLGNKRNHSISWSNWDEPAPPDEPVIPEPVEERWWENHTTIFTATQPDTL